jgi:hypothetical protein
VQQVQFVEGLPLLLGAAQKIPRRGTEVTDVVDEDVDSRIVNGQRGFGHSGHHVTIADVADDDGAFAAC